MLLSLVSCPPPEVLNYWCIYKDAASTINFGMDSEDSRTVYCGNLPSKITEELLYELFLQAGPIENVSLPRDRNGEQRHFAFVTFKHECSVDYSIFIFEGTCFFGEELQLKRRKPGPPAPLRNFPTMGYPHGSFLPQMQQFRPHENFSPPHMFVPSTISGMPNFTPPFISSQQMERDSFNGFNDRNRRTHGESRNNHVNSYENERQRRYKDDEKDHFDSSFVGDRQRTDRSGNYDRHRKPYEHDRNSYVRERERRTYEEERSRRDRNRSGYHDRNNYDDGAITYNSRQNNHNQHKHFL